MKTLQEQLKNALQINEDSINDKFKKAIVNKIKEINKAFRKSEDEYEDFADYIIGDSEGAVADLSDKGQREYYKARKEIRDYTKQIPKIQKNILSILQKLTKATSSSEIDDAIEQIDTILSEDIDAEITMRCETLLQIFRPDDYLADGLINCGFYTTVADLLDWLCVINT